MSDLDELRKQIDSIDENLIDLINKRSEIVIEVGKVKSEQGIKVFSPSREKKINEKIQGLNKGKFPNKSLITIFREIMSASRSLQKNIRVAFLGPQASFSHAASNEIFGSSTETYPLASIADVFFEIEKGKADYGVVPIENSYEGLVTYTLDKFVDSPLKICSETLCRIHHCLLGNVENLSSIKKLYSHPQILSQCRMWIDTNLPHVERIETSSSTKAASIVAWDKYSAAIASEDAAVLHDLKILARNIEDSPENFTRFLVIGDQEIEATGNDKTSILAKIIDKPGALMNILKPFNDMDINLTKIESRPSKRKAWDYIFFIDCDGHIKDEKIAGAIKKVEEYCTEVKLLGSYPKHQEIKDNRKPGPIVNVGR